MAMNIIGVGLGRTGTFSLRLALNRLGFGPCHHMEEVIHNMETQVPLWAETLEGNYDWSKTFQGYKSAVDWPVAAFYREMVKEYPDAKFILTERSPESWADSFGSTILTFLAGRAEAPPHMQAWLEMAYGVIQRTGFHDGMDKEELMRGFIAHNKVVREVVPADKLLEFQVTQGWEPLCKFLGVSVPADEPFPRANSREEFWEIVKGGQQ